MPTKSNFFQKSTALIKTTSSRFGFIHPVLCEVNNEATSLSPQDLAVFLKKVMANKQIVDEMFETFQQGAPAGFFVTFVTFLGGFVFCWKSFGGE